MSDNEAKRINPSSRTRHVLPRDKMSKPAGDAQSRAASLAAHIDSWAPNGFVMEHAARVPYTIRCIKSGLNDLQARRLRTVLVAQAPRNLLTPRGSIVQTPNCWLHEELHLPETVLENQQG